MTPNPNMKTVCDNCGATYVVRHDLRDEYIEQYCPFCGEEHENIDDMDEVNWDDED